MSFHADPVFPISGMDHGFRKSGNLKDFPELLFCWIEQFISRNIFLLLFSQMSILINICYQQEGTAFFQYSVDFLQICLRIRPEIEAFYGDDLVNRVIFKFQLVDISQLRI